MKSELRVEESPFGPVVSPPDPVDTVILYLPGDPDASADTAGHLALASRSTVLVCRRRPGLPAALAEDLHAGYRYCQSLGPVAVVGERMGATLAAALLVQRRDWGAGLPRCAMLISAALDLTLRANSVSLNVRADPTLGIEDLRRHVAQYAGGCVLTDPLVSPLYANLHGLPPIQILVAGTDLLLDDSLAFAARAARSGVSVDLRVWPEAAELRAESRSVMIDFMASRSSTAGMRTSA